MHTYSDSGRGSEEMSVGGEGQGLNPTPPFTSWVTQTTC